MLLPFAVRTGLEPVTPCVTGSGGVSKVDDIVALDEAGVPGVIFGKALYEGHITLKDLRIFL